MVTLPGAFVGMLLGGVDPIQAAAVQLLVLVGLLVAEAIAISVVLELVSVVSGVAFSPNTPLTTRQLDSCGDVERIVNTRGAEDLLTWTQRH
jgi:hypothetical protein